jgi:hypothetical protein
MLFRRAALLSAFAAATLCFLLPKDADAEKIDGFSVKILPLPTFDKRSHPDSETGEVERFVGNQDGAVDPFYKLPGAAGRKPISGHFSQRLGDLYIYVDTYSAGALRPGRTTRP